MRSLPKRLTHWGLSFALGAALAGCSVIPGGPGQSAKESSLRPAPFDPPPPGLHPARIGIPKFEVSYLFDLDPRLSYIAADQLTTLAANSGRFRVIERAQIEKILDEQIGGQGNVDPAELAKRGKIRGVDYLILGKVTNLQVNTYEGSFAAKLAWSVLRKVTGSNVKLFYANAKITTECGIDLRLVDTTTGEVVVSDFTDYTKTDSIKAFGVSIAGFSNSDRSRLRIDSASQGKVLRLALADVMKKMLPKIDKMLLAQSSGDDQSQLARSGS